MKVEVKGMNLCSAYSSKSGFDVLCTADIGLPELQITFHNVALSWSAERGFKALPAKFKAVASRAVSWRQDGPAATAMAEAIVAMYEKMGGTLPDTAAKVHERADDYDAAVRANQKAEDAKPRPVPVRSVEEIDATMAVTEMGLSRGLERTLGIAS
ncbi:hypothetical protein ASC80_07415 [Afipia sp. Root123D2]|uniref:hypothetical protein n=1 Tax=Afipia sp. Root123D2 TaxID=1736436 RepID=UPI0006FC3C5D|nr:hypothetical protein [Afipia sp. Root123D2]KQW23125.1 hypothetical protein ASC80_07415 [Afipia sp. Root123D2]